MNRRELRKRLKDVEEFITGSGPEQPAVTLAVTRGVVRALISELSGPRPAHPALGLVMRRLEARRRRRGGRP